MPSSQRSQQYKFTEAYIYADRDGGIPYHVNTSIVELVLYESLDKPYISGQIAITDDAGLFDAMNFMGTERLKIVLASEDLSMEPVLDREFIMTGIESITKSSDTGTSSIYVFTLIDEHAFLSALKKISRTVKGTLEDEILRICTVDLNKDVDISYSTSSAQTDFVCNIPNLNPLDAALWLTERATSNTSCPYFLYASMHDTNLRLGNLEVMLQQPAWNSKVPYFYSPANVTKSEERGSEAQNFQILSMRAAKMQNMLNLVRAGAIGSSYYNTNINTGRTTRTHIAAILTLAELEKANIIPNEGEHSQNIHDYFATFDDKIIDDYDSRTFHTITSTGTYGYKKSIHDEFNSTKFAQKIRSRSIINYLYKNMIEITVPGAGFIVSKASVGDIININIAADINDVKETTNPFDQLRSGNHLIYNARHTFKDTRHDVALTVTKLVRG